jgi:lipoate-protein ligase A
MSVRRIDMFGVPNSYWSAIDNLMAWEMYEGTFQNTVVVLRFSQQRPSLSIGINDDGDRIAPRLVREHGHVPFRHLCCGGGAGAFAAGLPLILYYYRKPYAKPDVTLLSQSNINGQANAAALRRLGLTAEYRAIGDTEILIEETRYKVIASYAGNYSLPDYWSACSSIIWASLPPETTKAYMECIYHYPEKFEDKQTKTPQSRMKPLEEVAKQQGVRIELDEVIDVVIEENIKALMDADKAIPSSWAKEEEEELARTVPYFESETWIKRLSTKHTCAMAPPGSQVGIAAYKSRKLIKASLIVDARGALQDCLLTGDFYWRPQATIFSPGALQYFREALRGIYLKESDEIKRAVESVFSKPDFEMPLISPEDVLRAIEKAGEQLIPVESYQQPIK